MIRTRFKVDIGVWQNHKAWRKGPTVQNKGEKIEKKIKGKGQNKPHHIGKKCQAGGQAVNLLLSLHPEHRALT